MSTLYPPCEHRPDARIDHSTPCVECEKERLNEMLGTADELAMPTKAEWQTMMSQIAEIHAFVANFTTASAVVSANPMMKVMMRNFGIDPDTFGSQKSIEG